MTLPAFAPALLLLTTPAPADSGMTPAEWLQVAPAPVMPTVPAPANDQSDPVVQAAPPVAEPPAQEAPIAEKPVAARHFHTPGDPLEGFNRKMFGIFQGLDKAIFRPAAMGYKHILPKPVRGGLRHFFSNIDEPLVAINYLLQFKPGKAMETLGRFVINSTLGVGGLIDVAKTRGFRLPHRPNSFGNTLAIWGVGPGPYIFLPFVGPTTLRDMIGGQGEGLVPPLAIGFPFDRYEYQIPRILVTNLDDRAESDDDLKALYAGAVDPYASLRSSYLQDRQGEIDHIRGKSARHAAPELDDPLADPAGATTTTSPATPAASSSAPELSDPLTDPAARPPTTAPAKPAPGPDTSDPLTDPAAPAPKP